VKDMVVKVHTMRHNQFISTVCSKYCLSINIMPSISNKDHIMARPCNTKKAKGKKSVGKETKIA